ncbi:MAG: hypothetical protein AAFP07_21730 [Cyanobacteria bacterium J06606_4]
MKIAALTTFLIPFLPYLLNLRKGEAETATETAGFYDALLAGRSVEFAYNLGCSAVELRGNSGYPMPVLIKKP